MLDKYYGPNYISVLNAYTNSQKCKLYLQLNATKPKDYNITQTSSPVGLYIPHIIKKGLKFSIRGIEIYSDSSGTYILMYVHTIVQIHIICTIY